MELRIIQWNADAYEDEITKWLTIDIQLPGKNKIRITNMYIPPIRETKQKENGGGTVAEY